MAMIPFGDYDVDALSHSANNWYPDLADSIRKCLSAQFQFPVQFDVITVTELDLLITQLTPFFTVSFVFSSFSTSKLPTRDPTAILLTIS